MSAGRHSVRGRPRRAASAGNVVQESTSFFGRAEDLRELRAALGRSRLVTLVGPGGIGKSRLARELGQELGPIFPGGVWLVELAKVSSGIAVAPAVARALGISEQTRSSLEEHIAQSLRASTVLILDNCEHVIDACAGVVAALLRESPNLRVLATSREPLEIEGERTFAVSALPVPQAPDAVLASDYTKFAAIELFVDRVASRDRAFRVTEENIAQIATISASVGGMPLAIELAAGRVSRVTLATLIGEIGEQLGFESPRRDIPERHRSMRAALATSYEALSPQEQALWKRLSVFPNGATLDALCAIGEHDGLGGDSVRTGLDGLIERSIVSLDSASAGGRYRMLEPIRVFGLEQARLIQEQDRLRRAHLEWCLRLVPEDAWVTGHDQLHWTRTVQAEYPSIAAALDYCLSEGDTTAGARLFISTCRFWGFSGWYGEVRHYAEALLSASPAPSRERTLLFGAAGGSSWFLPDVSQYWYQKMRVAAKRDPRAQGIARFGLGYCAIMTGAYDRAIRLLEQARELLEQSATTVPLAQARYALSQAYAFGKHDYATAREVVEPNLRRAARDDVWNRAMTHVQLGLIDWREGSFDDAERHLHQALGLQTELGHRFGLAASLEYLAWIAFSKDEPVRAAQLLGYANGVFERIGVNLVPALVPDHERITGLTRESLGSERYRALTRAGALLRETEIVELAQRRGTTPDPDGRELLTGRELEVAELVAKGATNTQISLELVIAHETVKTHIRSILRKLGFESRVQIAAWYGSREQIQS